jgi:hypothetical protein
MASLLENITPDKKYTAAEVLDSEVTHLISKMYPYEISRDNPVDREIIKGFRDDLVRIRSAIQKICK